MKLPRISGHQAVAVAALVAVNVMWGLSFPVQRCLNLLVDQHFSVSESTASGTLRATSSSLMIGVRFGFAFFLFAIFFLARMKSIRFEQILGGIALGSLFFIGMMLQVSGLATIPASRSGFLTSLAVVVTPLMSSLFQRRKPRWTSIAGAAISVVGVCVLTEMVTLNQHSLAFAEDAFSRWRIGDTLTLVAVIFFSFQIVLLDTLGKRMDTLLVTPSMFATAATLAIVTFLLLSGGAESSPTSDSVAQSQQNATWWKLATGPPFLSLVAVLSVFSSLIAFAWMNKYQPRITATQAAVVYTLEPLFALVWALFLPAILAPLINVDYANEQVSSELFIGGGLLVVANLVAMFPGRKTEAM